MKTPNGDLDRCPHPADASARCTIFAQGRIVEGNVDSSGPVEVQSKTIGSLCAPDIVFAAFGRIDGSVVAHELSVLDAVTGMISP